MKIGLASIFVNDQDKALKFYTEKLGFVVNTDMPMGDGRWLTVTSPDGIEGVELLLEPLAFAPARDYQKALYDAGIPATAFFTSDIDAECARLRERGVVFTAEPTRAPWGAYANFEDTVGNIINLVQTG